MVLMSDTGGGHRASAEALQAGFEQLYGNDFQVCLHSVVFSNPVRMGCCCDHASAASS